MFFAALVVSFFSGVFACLSGLAQFLIPGLYEVVHTRSRGNRLRARRSNKHRSDEENSFSLHSNSST